MALFFAVLFFFVGGRSAVLVICTDTAFACAISEAVGYIPGPIGWLAGAGLLLILGAAVCFRQSRRARP